MAGMSSKPRAPLGASLIVVSSVFYASYGIWTKLMGNFFGGYTSAAFRSVLVLLLLLPIALVFHKLESINWKRNWKYLAAMVFFSLFVWGPLYYSILQAGIGISLTINYACIVIGIFFFGWLLAGEKFTKDKLLSAGLGLVGLGLVFSPSMSSVGSLALFAAAISGFAAAANTVLAKQIHYNATQSTVALWATSLVANILMAFVFREVHPSIGAHVQWLYLAAFAVVSVIASWAFTAGLKLIDAGAAGVLGLLEVVFSVLFGVVFFHERPGVVVIGGVVIILAASAIPYFKDYNAKRGTLN